MSFSRLIRISRPRFWHYILGPMLIYFASSDFFDVMQRSFSNWWTDWIFDLVILFIILGYFTLPANLWIYWWNDIADWDTDKFNSKKWSYEAKMEDSISIKNKLKWNIWLWNIGYIIIWWGIVFLIGMTMDCFPWHVNKLLCSGFFNSPSLLFKNFLVILFSSHIWVILSYLIVFFLSSYLYSCNPLRAKSKPFIDGIVNILYISTPFSIIIINNILNPYINHNFYAISYNLIAAWAWVIAMHCYSAIPDIEPDYQAWLTTTAVYLWKQKSLIYCAILYIISTFFSFFTLWWFSIIWWIIYITMIILSYNRKDIFWLYKLFPYINLIIWFLLFWYIILYI